MLTTPRVLVLFLVLLPLISAVIVPLFGRVARRAALVLALLNLGLTAAVVMCAIPVLNDDSKQTTILPSDGKTEVGFKPRFVPGDVAGRETNSHRTGWTLMRLSAEPTPYGHGGPNIQFFLGVDGLNLWLVALAAVMLVPAILVSWESVTDRPGAFYGWMFLLEAGAVGAFLSFDVILFYVFFELTLIPAFFLIGRWGDGATRRDAARKFFLYTLAGSLLTLVGVIGVVLTNPDQNGSITFSLPDLMKNVQLKLNAAFTAAQAGNPEALTAAHNTQFWLFIALMAGFMVKVPIWPFHTWLPSAYGQAPIGVTVLLTSLLAKLGTFGILRFVLTLTPDAAITYGLPTVGTLAAFGIVYGAFCAYDQKDLRLLVAYSSISHLGFLVLGLFSFNLTGLSGASLHMVNHGLTAGGLFALLAFLLDRYRTTQTGQFGGLMGRFPNYAVLAFVLCLASIGLPGLNSFVSEMLMVGGLFDHRNPGIHRLGLAVVAVLGILLSAWYILTMLRRVFFGPEREPPTDMTGPPPTDVKGRELIAFGWLAGLCLLLGLCPQLVLDSMKDDVRRLSAIGEAARMRVVGHPLPIEEPELRGEIAPSKQPPEGGPKKGPPKGKGPPRGKNAPKMGEEEE